VTVLKNGTLIFAPTQTIPMRKSLILLSALFLFLSGAVYAQSTERTELEKKRKQTLQEIDILNRQYNEPGAIGRDSTEDRPAEPNDR
jgi:hypothetical protein